MMTEQAIDSIARVTSKIAGHNPGVRVADWLSAVYHKDALSKISGAEEYARYISGERLFKTEPEDFNFCIVGYNTIKNPLFKYPEDFDDDEAYRKYVKDHPDQPRELNIVEVMIRDKHYSAIETIAERLSYIKDATLYDYRSLAEKMGFDIMAMSKYKEGTVFYSQKLRLVYEAKQAEAKDMKLLYDYNHSSVGGNDDIHVETRSVIRVPATIHVNHQPNVLMTPGLPDDAFQAYPLPDEDVEFTPPDLPEELVEWIDKSWKEFNTHSKAVYQPETPVPKYVRVTSPLDFKVKYYLHPNYGTYGRFQYELKEDFKGYYRSSLHYIPGTYSTQLDNAVPAVLFYWNRKDQETIKYAAAGRMARQPRTEHYNLQEMRPYIQQAVQWLTRQIDIFLTPEEKMITPQQAFTWLFSRNFPLSKKAKYIESFFKAMASVDEFKPANEIAWETQGFPKVEGYPAKDKPQRLILAGNLQAATIMAPIVDIIGNIFFSLPFTSKKIPVRQRPAVAIKRFGNGKVILNDMSAYECSISADIKKLMEDELFEHYFPGCKAYIKRNEENIYTRVDLDRKSRRTFNFFVKNCRRSGEPQTSLGNSITNICSIYAAHLYVRSKIEEHLQQPYNLPPIWVEGDDSLCGIPDAWHFGHNYEDSEQFCLEHYKMAFLKMGFATKMELKNFVGEAGYCSMFFDQRAVNSPAVTKTILEFPWDHNHTGYGKELLKLKASSIVNEAPGQPITWAIAARHLNGEPFSIKLPYNSYEAEEYERDGYNVRIVGDGMVVTCPAGMSDPIAPTAENRALFARRYDISPAKQEYIEMLILDYGLDAVWDNLSTRLDLYRMAAIDGINLDDCHMNYEANIRESLDNYHDDNVHFKGECRSKVVDGVLVDEYRIEPFLQKNRVKQMKRITVKARNPFEAVREFEEQRKTQRENLHNREVRNAFLTDDGTAGLKKLYKRKSFEKKKWKILAKIFHRRHRRQKRSSEGLLKGNPWAEPPPQPPVQEPMFLEFGEGEEEEVEEPDPVLLVPPHEPPPLPPPMPPDPGVLHEPEMAEDGEVVGWDDLDVEPEPIQEPQAPGHDEVVDILGLGPFLPQQALPPHIPPPPDPQPVPQPVLVFHPPPPAGPAAHDEPLGEESDDVDEIAFFDGLAAALHDGDEQDEEQSEHQPSEHEHLFPGFVFEEEEAESDPEVHQVIPAGAVEPIIVHAPNVHLLGHHFVNNHHDAVVVMVAADQDESSQDSVHEA